jgi:hypothetical protein
MLRTWLMPDRAAAESGERDRKIYHVNHPIAINHLSRAGFQLLVMLPVGHPVLDCPMDLAQHSPHRWLGHTVQRTILRTRQGQRILFRGGRLET